jgi:predicted dehydrogenase
MSKIKIGVFGAGHLGKIHLKCLQKTDFEIIGVFDPDPEAQQFVKENYTFPVFDSVSALLDAVDAVDIVSTTPTHFDIGIEAIRRGKHAFIEKPIASTLEQARALERATQSNNVKVQVGHVERYNPAIVSLQDRNVSPKFIEGHRLSTFNTRGNDVSVILDLMIHDIDLILDLVKSEIKDVQANGVCVVNDTPDICNARITFENGCVANLTASRISVKQMRKLRLFQENEYISLDFLKKETQIIRIQPLPEGEQTSAMTIDTATGKKIISIENPAIIENNAIEEELKDFYNSIKQNKPVSVSVGAGVRALELAHLIASKI